METMHDMKNLARDEFERWAASYDRSLINYVLFKPSYRLMLDYLRRFLDDIPRRPLRVLDLGCGTGTYGDWCLKHDLPVQFYGLDMAYNMVAIANEKSRRRHNEDRFHFLVGDSEHLPFAENAIDVITCSNSFHHYPHQLSALRGMKQVLRPGGKLLILDGCRDQPIGYLVFDVAVATAEKQVHHLPAAKFRDYFHKAGFTHVGQRTWGLFPPIQITFGTAE